MGRCSMCREIREVRYLDLYVFGSEGVQLCRECENKVNAFIEKEAHVALRRRRDTRLGKDNPWLGPHIIKHKQIKE